MDERRDFESFPLEYLLDFIQQKDWPNVNASIKDLENPTGPFVQTIFFKILSDFNYSESFINTHQPEFDILEELGEHAGMYQELLPVISLLAAMQNLLTRIMGDHTFGYYDLTSPTSKRFRKFLSILTNFYNFSNQEWSKVEAIKASVDQMVQAKRDLAVRNEELKNKINYYKSKAVEEAAEEESFKTENEDLKMKLAELTEHHRSLFAIKEKEKQRFEEEEKKTKELEEELKHLQNERDQIQAIVDAEAFQVRLDKVLGEHKEELASKEKNLVENRKRVEEEEKTWKECQYLLETVQQISAEKQTIKTINNQVEELKRNIENVSMEKRETERICQEEVVRMKEKQESMHKVKNQWSRRKEGKQEELDQAKQELEEAKLDCSDEQQKAMELENGLRDLELELGEVQDSTTVEARNVRLQYGKILQNVNKFNEKMSSDLGKLNDAKDKLNEASSAL